jgi:uncharacterized protein YjbI with pentapeptide repeats
MQSTFHKFSVKIIEKPFYADNDISYPATALITFYDKHGHFMFSEDYGYLTVKEIYDKLEKDECLNLDCCYVKNFSFTTFRRIQLLNKNARVSIKSISAKQAFFHSEYNIDFSFIDVKTGDVDFEGSCFYSEKLLFVGSSFGKGNVDLSNVVFRSEVNDFSNAVFGGDVTFKNSIFSDSTKIFKYTDFGEGDLSFVNVYFGKGDVSFLNTNFNTGKVSFKVAVFDTGKVNFHFSTFGSGDVSFERTSFGDGIVDFRAVSFGIGKINFNRSVFGDGDIFFEGSSLEGRITFKRTVFGKGILSFEIAEFENTEVNFEKAVFDNCKLTFFNGAFLRLIMKGCHFDNYLDLRVRKCKEVNLSDTVVRDIIDFKQYDFKVDVEELNIAAMRLLGVIYIDWDDNNVKQMIDNQKNTTVLEKAEQYRILKESFNAAGQYKDEDKSYVLFKRYEMKSDYDKSIKDNKWKAIYNSPTYFIKKIVFDYIGLFATAPLRVLFSMLATYVFFSLIYSLVLYFNVGDIVSSFGGEHSAIGILGKSFYHSGITFFTIGYGDFYPMGIMRWLSQIEGFVGVFLMSYFTVAFVHNVLR